MLDQQHRNFTVIADFADQIAEHVDFLVIEAAGRLVEQQDLGVCGQSARQFDALLGAERQSRDHGVGDALEIEIAQDVVHLLVHVVLAAADPGKAQRVADDVARGARMRADAHIVDHG